MTERSQKPKKNLPSMRLPPPLDPLPLSGSDMDVTCGYPYPKGY
jgi:hypothetical protein